MPKKAPKLTSALILAVLAAPAPAAAAAAEASPPDDPAIRATIAALEAGDLAEADWLVTQVGSLQFPGITPPTRAEALQTLAGCKAQEQSRGAAEPYVYVVYRWRCRGQTFVGKLIPVEGGGAVALVDVLTENEYKARAQQFPKAPPPPPIIAPPPGQRSGLSAEAEARRQARQAAEMEGKAALAGLWAEAVVKGDLSAFALRHPTHATTTYGFFDPFAKREYIDRAWRSGDDLAEAGELVADAIAHAQSELGRPVSGACEDAAPYVLCTWRFADPGTRLTAEVHVFRKDAPNWGLSVFKLRYETAAKLSEAERRAGAAAPRP